MGGLRRQCQAGPTSCPASGAVFSSSLPAPFGFCRSSLQAGGNTLPGGVTARGFYSIHFNSV